MLVCTFFFYQHNLVQSYMIDKTRTSTHCVFLISIVHSLIYLIFHRKLTILNDVLLIFQYQCPHIKRPSCLRFLLCWFLFAQWQAHECWHYQMINEPPPTFCNPNMSSWMIICMYFCKGVNTNAETQTRTKSH